MNYPIAMIPYANMAPYAALGPPEGCYFVDCMPRNSIQALQSGAVWAAAVPVGGLEALHGVVTPLGLFGIAAFQEVMSVLFFSDRPLDSFQPAMTVRLTQESASSVRLCHLLMSYRLGIDRMPALAAPGAPANGEVVIGDTALQWLHEWEGRGRVKSYAHVTDLAALWYQQHQLPFVFARWVVRSDAPERVRSHLSDWLDVFADQEPALIERSVPRVATHLNLPHAYVRRYLKVIRRCLTPLDEAGQARFHEEWRAQAARSAWFADEPTLSAHRTHCHG
jgi:chorismate dehydratase